MVTTPQPGDVPQRVPAGGITRRHPILPERWSIWFWGHLRRVVVSVIGGTILLMGLAMLVLPGPGWLTIFAGLGVLATEFAWARWLLRRARREVGQVIDLARNGRTGKTPERQPTPQTSDLPKSAAG